VTHKNVSNFGTELLSVFSKQTFFSETYTSRLIFLTLTDILTVEVFVRVYQRVRFYLPSSINFRYISGFPKLGAHNPYLGSLQGSSVGFYRYDFLSVINCTEPISCSVSEIKPSTCPTSLYLATPLAFYPRRRGSPGAIFVKFCTAVIRQLGYKMAYKHCRKF